MFVIVLLVWIDFWGYNFFNKNIFYKIDCYELMLSNYFWLGVKSMWEVSVRNEGFDGEVEKIWRIW